MDGEQAIEAVTISEKLKENKFIGFSMCDTKGEEPDDIKDLPEVEEEVKEEEKDDSVYGRFIALKKLEAPKRQDDQLSCSEKVYRQELNDHIFSENTLFKLLAILEYMISLTESVPPLL